MCNRPDPPPRAAHAQPQRWSVRAQFTVSHPGADDPANRPRTDTIRDENGVTMSYSWSSAEQHPSPARSVGRSDSGNARSTDSCASFGYRSGDLFFTSTPPERNPSGEVGGKCRSSCSIVLSSANEAPSRTGSLRCQTPSVGVGGASGAGAFYGCGDPWCHHSRSFVVKGDKKDACVQTYEMIDKCTSPFRVENFNKSPVPFAKGGASKLARNRPVGGSFRKNDKGRSPTLTPDSLEILKPLRRDRRLPNLTRAMAVDEEDKKAKIPHGSDKLGDKKSRTIHIDVYCTDTEMETDSDSSSSSKNDSASTPQTVFESSNVCVTHKRADEKIVPFHLRDTKDRALINSSYEKDDSDDDGLSTAYPSKLSSYSTIPDFSSSISSMPKSLTNYSLSSCTIPDDESVTNTSWKDTFSDIDSLLNSSASLGPNDSLYFVPGRLLEKDASIDETPELENNASEVVTVKSNCAGLQLSDSFEYANSEDRVRIKKMEEMWQRKPRPWRSPQNERKLLLQQKKMQGYFAKKLVESRSLENDSDGSEDSETGWTFVKRQDGKSEQTVKKTDEDVAKNEVKDGNLPLKPFVVVSEAKESKKGAAEELAALSDSSPSSSFRSTNTILQNFPPVKLSDQWSIASRFGTVVNKARKLGHHVGPVRNPHCLCDHCLRHFESLGYRNRTRSVGDPPSYTTRNWKEGKVSGNENESKSNNAQ